MSEERLGALVPNWAAPAAPVGDVLDGAFVRLERMDADAHAADLHRAYSGHDRLWDYMPYGPFSSAAAYHRWAKDTASAEDPLFYVLRDKATGHCGGGRKLSAHHACGRLDRGGPHLPCARSGARPGLDRGDVPDDGLGLCQRLSPL